MASVQVIQRNAHLAGPVRVEVVKAREGAVSKATLIAISNEYRGSGDSREERSTALRWTLWGVQAENAGAYLHKGSHINLVGRLNNNHYEKDGKPVFGLDFTVEEIDYLDSRADAKARRSAGQKSAANA